MTRYLLVKSHVGFGDRLQCLSHAMTYASKFNRTICIDWSDSAWSDGRLNFETYFSLCGVDSIGLPDLLQLDIESVFPQGWLNQLDRRADSKFIYKSEYVTTLPDADVEAEVVVYSSTGHRVFHQQNLCLLRLKRPYRDQVIAELQRANEYRVVVHLRGTDRNGPQQHDAYLKTMTSASIPKSEPLLVVTDSLSLFQQFQTQYPNAVLRTPELGQFGDQHGTHFQTVHSKHDFNMQTLIDFFIIMYAPVCIADGKSIFSSLARFLHEGDYCNILGYDGFTTPS